MREEQLQELSRLLDQQLAAMKRFLDTGNKTELDEADRITEQMKQIRESAEQ